MSTQATLPPETPAEARAGAVLCSSAWLGRIVCGDNTEILSRMPSECIDLVVTSPPYDDIREYGGHSWNFDGLAAQLLRVLKPGGVIVWVVGDKTEGGNESGTSMRQALGFQTAGLNLHDTMIYEKCGAFERKGHRTYPQAFEFMFVLSKGSPKTFNIIRDRKNSLGGQVHRPTLRQPDGTMKRGASWGREIREVGARTNIWRYSVGWMKSASDAVAFEHPAIMPEALASDHIASWSNPGDVVLDPFLGSGTTCKAAKALNRQWCGIEVNPDYCRIAEARLSQDVLQLETCPTCHGRKIIIPFGYAGEPWDCPTCTTK